MYDRDLDITIGHEPRPARPLLRFVPSVEYRRLTCGCLQERSGRVPYRTWRLTDQCRKHQLADTLQDAAITVAGHVRWAWRLAERWHVWELLVLTVTTLLAIAAIIAWGVILQAY